MDVLTAYFEQKSVRFTSKNLNYLEEIVIKIINLL